MFRLRGLLLPALIAAVVVGCGVNDKRPAIIPAVRAPLVAYVNRDAKGLCESLTRPVASHLAGGTTDCERGAARAFADLAHIGEHYAPRELPTGLRIKVLSVRGDHATASTTWPWPDIRRVVRLALVRSDGRWRIATATKMMSYIDCVQFRESPVHCDAAHGIEFGTGPNTVREPTTILRRSGSVSSEGAMRWYRSEPELPKR